MKSLDNLIYKWFKVPKNLGQFMDKARRAGDRNIGIELHDEFDMGYYGDGFHEGYIRFKSAHAKYKSNEVLTDSISPSPLEGIPNELYVKYSLLKHAIQHAERLEHAGFAVMLSASSVVKAKEIAAGLEEHRTQEYFEDTLRYYFPESREDFGRRITARYEG